MGNTTKIKVLPQDLINKIAAGEVVERPASVVKELVENSVDAGATQITIEIDNGGMYTIRVIDNGSGMSPEDARLSIVQHATSKIDKPQDLFALSSLGFRGEALASIAAVSEFSLITKQADTLAGTEITVRNKAIVEKTIGCPVGTTITVNNLFSTIPARKKYLKSPVTEYNHIMDLFLHYVLVYPSIGWKLVHNDKVVHQYAAVSGRKDRLAAVFGHEIASLVIPVKHNGAAVSVNGFVGKPQIARNNRKLQYIFVNDRPVHEYIIAKQVRDAYATLLPRDMHPVFVLFLTVDPEKIDVNVHPRKIEVRFSSPQEVYRAVYRSVGEALDSFDLQKIVSPPSTASPVKTVAELQPFMSSPRTSDSVRTSSRGSSTIPTPESPLSTLSIQTPKQESLIPVVPEVTETKMTVGRILGQAHASYIVVEASEGIEIYDQHAVSERIRYEAIKAQWMAQSLSAQRLLLPQTIELASLEARIVLMNKPFFDKLGFELTELSNNTFMINAVPQELHAEDSVKIIKDIIGEMGQWEVGVFDQLIEGLIEPVDKVLKMMACRSAVMFGDAMTLEEMQVMLEKLKMLPNQYTCVHGRPCVLSYPKLTLNKLFKRPV